MVDRRDPAGRGVSQPCEVCQENAEVAVKAEQERDALAAQVRALTDETEERAAELLRVREDSDRPKCLYCAFGETGDRVTHEQLVAHVETECQRHPIFRLKAQVRVLREALTSHGYHAPGNGRCQHGLRHWLGDHCLYDEPALAATAEPEEPR